MKRKRREEGGLKGEDEKERGEGGEGKEEREEREGRPGGQGGEVQERETIQRNTYSNTTFCYLTVGYIIHKPFSLLALLRDTEDKHPKSN